jgi:hypothetical protein
VKGSRKVEEHGGFEVESRKGGAFEVVVSEAVASRLEGQWCRLPWYTSPKRTTGGATGRRSSAPGTLARPMRGQGINGGVGMGFGREWAIWRCWSVCGEEWPFVDFKAPLRRGHERRHTSSSRKSSLAAEHSQAKRLCQSRRPLISCILYPVTVINLCPGCRYPFSTRSGTVVLCDCIENAVLWPRSCIQYFLQPTSQPRQSALLLSLCHNPPATVGSGRRGEL